jgi:3beta-hydroxy-delta5-steroid dehydrogenase/steroid delta-isomerase
MKNNKTSNKLTDIARNQVSPLGHCLVTGGAGFLGRNIAKALLARGCKVRVLDRVNVDYSHENLTNLIADLSDTATLERACEGIDCVFHTASIIELGGGSAAPMSYRQRSIDVNVKGSQAVIDACKKAGVKRVVYTSSNVVCYNGTPVTGLNSDTPYAHRVYDMYTETKIAAEKMILSSSGKDGLLTCAIRPSGIYGAESNMMLDKFVAECAAGKLVAALGTPNAVHENSFIDNLVHGHILAAERLVEGNRCCGRGYFISDNEPENYFEFFRPLIEGLGYAFPRKWIPMGALMPLLTVWQWLHFKYGLPAPMMRPKELDKVCTTHISDIREPAQDLDYEPLYTVAEAMEKCLPYCRNLHDQLKNPGHNKLETGA